MEEIKSIELGKLIDSHRKIFIISHIRPDGDAYGSTLGLGWALRVLGHDVMISNEDGMAHAFQFLPGSDSLIKTPVEAPEVDRLIISVDTSESARLGATFVGWNRRPDVNIDHHVSNPGYGKMNLIDAGSPATAQVLYDIFETLHWPLSPEVAANLYVGLMTDTGSFRYRNTTARSLEIGAKLISAGADPTDLAQACYQNFRAARLRLEREMLNAMHFNGDERIAWFLLTPDMFVRSGATSDETEGMIESLQSVRSVEVAFVLETMPDGMTRGSLRSRGTVDVQKICAQFGGGGHRLAAGLRSPIPAVDLESQVLAAIERELPPI